jgi:hypothetical protein
MSDDTLMLAVLGAVLNLVGAAGIGTGYLSGHRSIIAVAIIVCGTFLLAKAGGLL